MRVASLSFLVYSLSLLTVTAGQSKAVTELDAITSAVAGATTAAETTADTAPTSTSSSESTESTSSTSSAETTAAETTSSAEQPTTTSSSEAPSTTDQAATTTSSSSSPATTDGPSTTSDPSSTSSSSSSSSSTTQLTTSHTVKTITTIHTISGTPIPTTLTTTSASVGEVTNPPGLNNDSGSGNSSGLSSSSKKTIVGVCVGVGGAIVLGAVALVFWRMNARKRHAQENDEATDLMSGTAVGAGAREKAPSPASGTPFRSTLDQYHNPGPVNAASNF
ncbi:hypothetical protein ASPWEDRAFT_36978 [Aspergillus wentii DTO 134E9]|uniref:Mid2 domain-containing protein n=1 Tax=Aspergillus wentii DTO 134E9 TaxID=1073089 RepID=A0A1L9RWH4_ASPWE|nr:uncharacterized protein ASPWEDRAFT_36978 [Aspergillus wentii DTO 134E9]KAI9929073.1 hypothetical protein MW887_001468 [Aspergillus wentii]OJJ39233.1 hypothetical protein ASPWEDRAFT_36978 [Aspergillus wentii DTO 134E9]